MTTLRTVLPEEINGRDDTPSKCTYAPFRGSYGMNQTRQQRRAAQRRANKQGTAHVETLTRAEAEARGVAVCLCCPDAGVTIRTETCIVDEAELSRDELIAENARLRAGNARLWDELARQDERP